MGFTRDDNESDPQLLPLHLKLNVYLNPREFGEKGAE
jgi:hypothetical protein